MKTTVLIGDSIRIGYQEGVRERLAGTADVWGPTENGGDSRNVLAHLPEWVLEREPDLVHLNCGLHDIKRQFGAEENAVPLPEYRRNVREMLERILGRTGATALWATTTPVNQQWHHRNKGFDRFERDVEAYNDAAVAVCRELGVPLDDFYGEVMRAGRDELLLKDGVHFSPEGSALLAEKAASAVRVHL